MVELSSIAAGTRAADALVKKAQVRLERVGTLQPGMFALLFTGDVASVDEAFGEALRVGGRAVTDSLMLPHVDASVYLAVAGERASFDGDTLGVVETSTLSAAIEAADVAVKGASVRVASVRLGDELGGKGLVHLVGDHHDVAAALELVMARVPRHPRSVETSLTPRIDEGLLKALATSTRFWSARHS